MQPCYAMAKQLHFNKDGSALKKMQAGVDKLASVVGITLGPKVAYVVSTATMAIYHAQACSMLMSTLAAHCWSVFAWHRRGTCKVVLWTPCGLCRRRYEC